MNTKNKENITREKEKMKKEATSGIFWSSAYKPM
jgi:hypothetical protein